MDFFRQGEMDGLCGFYAALNAFWALFPDLDDPEERRKVHNYSTRQYVFDQAIGVLDRVSGVSILNVRGHPLFGGLDENHVQEFLEKLSRYWSRQTEVVQLSLVHNELSLTNFLTREKVK